MTTALTILFWLNFSFVFYTYVIYPLLIAGLARTRPQEPAHPPADWPSIGLIIPVHNEAHNLDRKLQNLREIDYPRDRMTITFISDGSTDATPDRLATCPDVRLIHYSPRQGKPTALNRGALAQTADILIFTDARQTLHPDAIKKLVARLLQPGVGAVSGELVHQDPQSLTAHNVGLYWRYEKWIRKNESRYGSVPGVTGALYAIRREDFHPIAGDTLLDDFEIPMHVLKQRKRVLLEEGAEIYDRLQESAEKEQIRKVRTLTGNFQSFARNPWLFSPFRNPIWLQFLSHKVFRLYVPYGLLLMFVSSLLAPHGQLRLALIAQILFYGLAWWGRHSARARNHRLVNFANVFVELNLAAVKALHRYRQQGADVKWEKTA